MSRGNWDYKNYIAIEQLKDIMEDCKKYNPELANKFTIMLGVLGDYLYDLDSHIMGDTIIEDMTAFQQKYWIELIGRLK